MGTKAGYQSYVRSWPQGRHADEAAARVDSFAWQEAIVGDTAYTYERYIDEQPEGERVAEARARIDSLDWVLAAARNTITSYRRYAAIQPQGKLVQEAEARSSALRSDPGPYQTALQAGTEEALGGFLEDFPGHKGERQVNQSLIEITEGRGITDLMGEGKISAEVRGSSIEHVSLRLTSSLTYPVKVRIPVGTFFVSADASRQNMVATESRSD